MPKTDGYITREKILEVSEKLFSEVGYDAASIGEISKMAGINKATIYYHFKDKQDILHSLYENMIREMVQRVNVENMSNKLILIEKIRKEIDYLREKKKILSILLMEAMKTNTRDNSLFRIAQSEIGKEKGRVPDIEKSKEKNDLFIMHEFFTGLMPTLIFIVLEEKYCDFFNVDKTKVIDMFIDTIKTTHFNTHIT